MERDAIASAVARIERFDAALRAFLAVDHGAAARPRRPGPLHGLPVAVKDAVRTSDLPTTYGTAAAPAFEPRGRDAAIVARLRAAGAVVVGKTNCGELCMGDYVLRGPPQNPRAPGRSVSGSSGGCAVAVAAGLVPASVCTDTGGSARIPAAFCGVPGLKLTTGSVPLEGALPLAPSLDAAGLVAASVGALRTVAEVVLGRPLGRKSPPRLAVVDAAAARRPEVARALDRIARRLACAVVAPPERGGWQQLHRAVVGEEAQAIHGHLVDDARLGAELRAFLAAEPPLRPEGDVRGRLAAAIDGALAGADVLVGPAVDGPPPTAPPPRDSDAFWHQLEWLAPVNHTGHPALVVPLPLDGPPLALQLIARHGDEAALLAAGAVVGAALRPRGAGGA
jgi:Asp-tRNA(Asn)/Glu-tRNA(Gln) amidotransferase A subunit family amidase